MALSLVPATGWGQGILSPKAAIIAEGSSDGRMAVREAGANYVTAYVSIDTRKTSWQELGLKPAAQWGNTATVRISTSQLRQLAKQEGVEYVQLTSGVGQMLDVARKEAGTDDIHRGTSLPQPYLSLIHI